jgi:c-di-GMP-related signal transduction protein
MVGVFYSNPELIRKRIANGAHQNRHSSLLTVQKNKSIKAVHLIDARETKLHYQLIGNRV